MVSNYLDVDWVELGCRGWEIDWSGADIDDGHGQHAHLDRTTLHLILDGHADWARRVIGDLLAANLFGKPIGTVTTNTDARYTSLIPTTWIAGYPAW